jgi:UDP:flavonoid glycosyltransferase YjiC (YdhE family)
MHSHILFIMHPERGHLTPVVKIARMLQERGHQVCFCGTQDLERLIDRSEFSFAPLFPNGFPAQPTSNLLSHEIRTTVERVRADLILTDYTTLALRNLDNSFMTEALKDTGVTSILLSTSIPNRTRFGSPDNTDTMIILCPREFDFPENAVKKGHYYAEASIDLRRKETDFPWHKLRPDKRLLYCSLGTESRRYPFSKAFLQTVVEAVAAKSEWQLILATGTHLQVSDFQPIPENVVVVTHAPQLRILERASLMITHGGLGTVKECIYFGVPMIVFPMGRDQPDNAARVVYHHLGLSGIMQKTSVAQIGQLIDRIDASPAFRANATAMKKIFRERERSSEAVRLIESFCVSSPLSASSALRG